MKEVPGVALNRLRGRSLQIKGKLSRLALLRRAQKASSDHLAAQSHGHVAQRADGPAQRECVGHWPRTRTASGVAVTLRRDGTRAGERHDGEWYHERHYSTNRLVLICSRKKNRAGYHPRRPRAQAAGRRGAGVCAASSFQRVRHDPCSMYAVATARSRRPPPDYDMNGTSANADRLDFPFRSVLTAPSERLRGETPQA